jgi:hypothetical protein
MIEDLKRESILSITHHALPLHLALPCLSSLAFIYRYSVAFFD